MAYNLPPINEEGLPVPNRTDDGWDQHETIILKDLATALKHDSMVENGQESGISFELTSIPDVWARVHVFRDALVDDRHPMHVQAVGEWRGLLTLLGLNSIQQLNISVSRLKFENHEFLKTAGKYHPADRLSHHDKQFSWEEIGIIHIDDLPLGFIVPNLLVCPAREYMQALSTIDAQWLSSAEGRKTLRCPVEIAIKENAYIEGVSYHVLEKYIGTLSSTLQAELNLNHDKYTDKLAMEMKRFLWDIQGLLNLEEFSSLPNISHYENSIPNSYDCSSYGYYRELLTTWDAGTDGSINADNFDATLQIRPEIKDKLGVKGVIYLGNDLPNLLGKQPISITLPFHRSFEGYRKMNKAARKGYEKKLLSADWLPVTKKDLFTCDLFHIDGAQAEFNPDGFQDYCVPLTPLAMILFSREQLHSKLSLDTSTNRKTVSLDVVLGNGQEVRLKQNFEKDTETDPIIAHQYPDFSSRVVSHYLLGTSCQPTCKVNTGLPIYIKLVESSMSRRNCRELRELFSSPDSLNLSSENFHKLVIDAQNGEKQAFYCMEKPPEFITLVKSGENTFAGCIFCKELNDIPARKTYSCDVGIDLGSSNTCLYWKTNLGNPEMTRLEQMNFDGHICSLIRTDDDYHYNMGMSQFGFNFIPWPEGAQTPFMTVMVDRMEKTTPGDSRPFMKSYIRLTAMNDLDLYSFRGLENRLRFNLKWDSESERGDVLQDFLTQLAYLVSVQAASLGISAGKISWRLTYPTTFTSALLGTFQKSAHHAIESALGIKPSNPTYHTESWSTAMYCFAKEIAPLTEETVTIDIGGKTSDITIWNEENPLWNCSLDFGAQKIVLEYISQTDNLSIAEHRRHAIAQHNNVAYDDEIITSFEQLIKEWPENTFCLELIAKRLFDTDSFHLTSEINAQQKFFEAIRPQLRLALAGLLYYLGRVVSLLYGDETQSKDSLTFCICGQGGIPFSTVLADDIPQLTKLFQSACDNDQLNTQIVFSENPKHEVSSGVLSRTGDMAENLPDPQYTPVECIEAGDMRCYNDFPPLDITLDKTWKVDRSLPEFRLFLTMYSEHFDSPAPKADYEKLATHANKILRDYKDLLNTSQDKTYKNIPPESPFITILKKYLESNYQSQQERN